MKSDPSVKAINDGTVLVRNMRMHCAFVRTCPNSFLMSSFEHLIVVVPRPTCGEVLYECKFFFDARNKILQNKECLRTRSEPLTTNQVRAQRLTDEREALKRQSLRVGPPLDLFGCSA